jgi:hypothetical protein
MMPYHEISKDTKCFRFEVDIVTHAVFGDGRAIHHVRNINYF